MQGFRQTKIVATLGPATDQPGVLEGLLRAGVNLVRLNMSHGTHADHEKRIIAVRAIAADLKVPVGILVDLQGPKIRIARFKEGPVFLTAGQPFILDSALPATDGTAEKVGLDYAGLVQDVKTGDELLLDDGRVSLKVERVSGTCIYCHVLAGGELSNHKGINLKGGGLSAKALTQKDQEDILALARWDADYVALSFVRSAQDIHEGRALLEKAGSQARLIAKMERTEAISAMDEIIDASDAIMVARGDLGVELGYADLPGVQKILIHRALARDKAVITATQMMAEVSDVANAVLDGTDAVMLSAETASGAYPVEAVQAMHDICLAAERRIIKTARPRRVEDTTLERIDEAVAMAAMHAANHLDLAAIIALTESGSTPLWMSRIRSRAPIYGLSRHPRTLGYMTLYSGVYPIAFDVTTGQPWEVSSRAIALLKKLEMVHSGDKVLITKGEVLGKMGGANAIKILPVE
jgi:pyruvate kinase